MTQVPAHIDGYGTASIPALLTQAGQRLLDARTSGEVLEAKKLAEAALHYARVTKAANDTHADCLRIITRAEIRMADEIDRGQASGEVARPGGDRDSIVQAPDNRSEATYDDLGISRQRVSEWREIRDAGEEVVEQAIQSALDEGRAPTKFDIRNHVRGTFGTGENEWYTPPEYIEAVRDVLGGIDLDPASSDAAQQCVRAERYFTKTTNGLERSWHGRVWLNPPYAQPHIADFVSKMVMELWAGHVTAAVMLTHNYTDTAWFHEAMTVADAVCFTRGRVKFYDAGGNVAAPTQGQAFFYYGENAAAFATRFRDIGFVVVPFRSEPK